MLSLKKIFLLEGKRKPVTFLPRFVYHVTTKPNTAKKILSVGMKPMSGGSDAVGEKEENKTYFFRDLGEAITFLDSSLGESEDPMATTNGRPDYKSWDPFDYTFSLLRIDTKKIQNPKFFEDEESYGMDTEWYFTTSFVPKEAIKIIPPKFFLQYLINFGWPDFGWPEESIASIKMPNDYQ